MNSSYHSKENKFANLIYIKPELFDHLIYPLPIKVDDNNIIQLFRKLHIMSTIDYKITLNEWIDQSIKNLNGFTEKEATVLFHSYKIYSSDLEQTSITNNRYEINSSNNKQTVDVRYFGLFFALQLFMQRLKLSINIDRDKTPWQNSSPISSPRGKSSGRSTVVGLEYQSIVNFIKSNIKLFLRLIASDIHNTETSLNSNEFNTLKFLFKLNEKKDKNLSNYAPFFVNFSTTTKINIDIISEWLSCAISNSLSEYDDLIQLKNLSKCVTIKDSQSINGKNIKIISCDESFIYLNGNTNLVKISNCFNCTILVAANNKIVSIDKCENCHITIASNLVRISNCTDTTINLYSMFDPIIFGDNRGLILSPHNCVYNELSTHLRNAKITVNSIFQNNFKNPLNMTKEERFEIIDPKDFSQLVVPFNNNEHLFLTPKEYIDVIYERLTMIGKIKQMIKDAGLFEEQEKALHVAIQGYFREWLISSGNIKSMTEIVKMIDINYENN